MSIIFILESIMFWERNSWRNSAKSDEVKIANSRIIFFIKFPFVNYDRIIQKLSISKVSKGFMASSKKIENAHRLRYVRVLERFFNSIISYLSKSEEPTKEQFIKRVSNAKNYLDRVEPIALYKSELTDLEALVKSIQELANSDEEIEDIKSDILHRANKLEQSSNNRRYRKDKHKSDKFKDWE